MRKMVWIVIGAVLLSMVGIAGVLYYLSMQPMYQPGMVRKMRDDLTPPEQTAGGNRWQVEPGIELAHFAVGQGRNVLVIHGGPGMPFLQPMRGLEPLENGYRFHYYDQRGCGESSRPVERFASKNMYENMRSLDAKLGLGAEIADIERIRRMLGDEKLILIGHSWGGFLAALYAAEFPEHVDALALISPANMLVMPQPDPESDLFAAVRAQLPAEEQAGFDAFMKDYMDFNGLFEKSEADLVAMNARFGEYYGRVMPAATLAPSQGKPGGWMTWGMYMSMGQRHDYRAPLRNVTAPTLVIHGANDLQSEAATRLYVEAFPNAQFAVVENAGHFSFEEQPEVFARIVGQFLRGLE